MSKLVREKETYQIIGLCTEVHRQLGFGFAEIVYKDAMEIEAQLNLVPYHREKQYTVIYKNRFLPHTFNADFVMFEDIIVEVKSSKNGISNDDIAQTLNYMRAAGFKMGLIVNFGKSSLEYKRLIL